MISIKIISALTGDLHGTFNHDPAVSKFHNRRCMTQSVKERGVGWVFFWGGSPSAIETLRNMLSICIRYICFSVLFGLSSWYPFSRKISGVNSSLWFSVLKVAAENVRKVLSSYGCHSDYNDEICRLSVDYIRPMYTANFHLFTGVPLINLGPPSRTHLRGSLSA